MTREEKIAQLRATPAIVTASVKGLTEKQLDVPYREGGWTAREVVHHIADSHMHAFLRMKLNLAEDHPTFKPYDQDVWVKMSDCKGPIAPSLAIITGLQERMADFFSDLTDDEWSRSAYHPENGEMTMDTLLNYYYEHGPHHAKQITGLREKMGW